MYVIFSGSMKWKFYDLSINYFFAGEDLFNRNLRISKFAEATSKTPHCHPLSRDMGKEPKAFANYNRASDNRVGSIDNIHH